MNPTMTVSATSNDEELRAAIAELIEQIEQMNAQTRVFQMHTEESQKQTRLRLEAIRETLRR